MDDECEAIGHLRRGDIRALEVLVGRKPTPD
jgi:hypothetical protein